MNRISAVTHENWQMNADSPNWREENGESFQMIRYWFLNVFDFIFSLCDDWMDIFIGHIWLEKFTLLSFPYFTYIYL